jgi:uncharacterized membrane protein
MVYFINKLRTSLDLKIFLNSVSMQFQKLHISVFKIHTTLIIIIIHNSELKVHRPRQHNYGQGNIFV